MEKEIVVRVNRVSKTIQLLANDSAGTPRWIPLDLAKVPNLIARLTEAVAFVESYGEDTKNLKV